MNKELIFILQQIRYAAYVYTTRNRNCLKFYWNLSNKLECNKYSCNNCPLGRKVPTRYSEQLIFSIEVSDEPRVNTNS